MVINLASQGTKKLDSLTIVIIPYHNTDNISAAVDIAIMTYLGNPRNNISILSSYIKITCGMGLGTTSEVR